MKKNDIKAIAYIVVGFVVALVAVLGMIAMYLSGTFLPVRIGSTYVVGNRIVRYLLYVLLLVIMIFSICLAEYGINFLIKKFHKK